MLRFIISITLLAALIFNAQVTVYGQFSTRLTLPLEPAEGTVKPLRQQVDGRLEADLRKKLNANAKWKRMIANKQMAVGIVDLSNPEEVRFARVNGNEMMYAASLPKIAILLAAMDALDKGEIQETPEVVSDLNQMIAISDNQASTRMIDLLGYEKIESVLKDPRYELYDTEYGGGLWVGKRYAKTGKRNPDPLMGLSHAATVSQVCRFYYLLAYGQLVSEERSRQMLEMMDDPKLHHKFVSVLDKVAPNAKVYRKSGSWSTYHSDSVLVWGPQRRYILVALVNDADGEAIVRKLVSAVEEVLKTKTAK